MKSFTPLASRRRTANWLPIAEHLLRAGFVALLFLAVLVPSDTPPDRGMFVAQSPGWGLLAMGVSLWLVFRRQPMPWSVVDTLGIGYLLWTAVAAVAVWGVGDLRAATNSFFQTAAFVLALLLGRQLLVGAEQRKSVLTVLLSLGSAMALLGLLQFFIFDPANREQIKAHPEMLLEPLGIFDHSSPEARRALDRALSPEPLGTFTLTNSLACFLTPWVIVLITAVSRSPARLPACSPAAAKVPHSDTLPEAPAGGRRALACGIAALAMLAACLWLTHSRMSILALLVGLVLLVMMRLAARSARHVATGIGVLVIVAVLVGAALTLAGNSSALAAARTSALYRFEYWQSTWAMIRDHWLVGVGPGNFKSVYPHYKLPQASEEIGDPHNFVLEVWATAGTPALLLLGALLATVLWRSWMKGEESGTWKPEVTEPTSAAASDERMAGRVDAKSSSRQFSPSFSTIWTLGGAMAAFLIVAVAGSLYSPTYLCILAPATALFFFALKPLVSDDLIPGALPIATVTMLVNLLAAGGIGFPGVAIPLAVLLVLVSHRSSPSLMLPTVPNTPASGHSFPIPATLTLAGSLVLYFSCYFLCYLPVMRADTVEIPQRMAADPFSPEVCRQIALAELEFVEHGSPERLGAMEEALDEAIRRDPRSHFSRIWAGDARLRAFRALQRRELLDAAIDNYAQAVERYPSWSFLHAQLAWAKHSAGDDAGAATAAQEALRLDDLCPHDDRKLRRQTLHDTAIAPLRILPLDEAMRRLAKRSPADR